MPVAVAHASAKNHQRMVQQGAIAIRRIFHFLHELGELLHMVIIELRQNGDLCRISTVVRNGVMGLGQTDLRVSPLTALSRHHEGGYAGKIRLIRRAHQFEHEGHVFLEVIRNTKRRIHDDRLAALGGLHALNTSLDFPQLLEVVVDATCDRWQAVSCPARLASPVMESMMLRSSSMRTRRCSALPARPNMRSKATLGLISIGNGVVGDDQHSVFKYKQLKPGMQPPT